MSMVVLFWGLLYVHSTQCMSQTSQHLLRCKFLFYTSGQETLCWALTQGTIRRPL